MDSGTVVVIIIVFALVVIAAFVIFRRVKAQITGPGGMGMSVEGSNEPPAAATGRSRIKAGDILAETGDAEIVSQRGDRDLEVGDVIAGKDVKIRDEVVPLETDPNSSPPA